MNEKHYIVISVQYLRVLALVKKVLNLTQSRKLLK